VFLEFSQGPDQIFKNSKKNFWYDFHEKMRKVFSEKSFGWKFHETLCLKERKVCQHSKQVEPVTTVWNLLEQLTSKYWDIRNFVNWLMFYNVILIQSLVFEIHLYLFYFCLLLHRPTQLKKKKIWNFSNKNKKKFF